MRPLNHSYCYSFEQYPCDRWRRQPCPPPPAPPSFPLHCQCPKAARRFSSHRRCRLALHHAEGFARRELRVHKGYGYPIVYHRSFCALWKEKKNPVCTEYISILCERFSFFLRIRIFFLSITMAEVDVKFLRGMSQPVEQLLLPLHAPGSRDEVWRLGVRRAFAVAPVRSAEQPRCREDEAAATAAQRPDRRPFLREQIGSRAGAPGVLAQKRAAVCTRRGSNLEPRG